MTEEPRTPDTMPMPAVTPEDEAEGETDSLKPEGRPIDDAGQAEKEREHPGTDAEPR